MTVKATTGLVSGLDTESIVSKLMAVERQPLTRLETKQTTVKSQISALGQIKSKIAALQDAAEAISSASSLYSYKATVATSSVASATTTSSAAAGTYSLEVVQLATNHKIKSSTTIDPSSGGTMTIELGSTSSGSFVSSSSTPVSISSGASLTDVAKAINTANAGVTATVVSGTSGSQLIVTSKDTGEAKQIKITSSITGLEFNPDDPSATGNMSQVTEAKDAIVKVDGITLANTSSNTVTDAVTGVTLTLTGTNKDNPTQLTISNDSSNLQSLLKTFVDAYNSARSTIKTLSKYDSSGTSTGVLNGDTTTSSALNQLRGLLSAVPSGAGSTYQYLSDLGISSSSDGTLSLDTTKLTKAMTADFSDVAKTVAAYGTAFNTLTTKMNGTDGLITSRIDGLTTTSSKLSDRIDSMERLLTITQTRYEAQFTSLEKILSSMQTTSTYLTQQLANLNKSSS